MTKKILNSLLVVTLVGALTSPHAVVNAAGDHGHGDEHPCGCEAEEFDFKIDCTGRQVMLDALDQLAFNNCDMNCDSPVCHKSFLIIQSHHDYCFHNEVPEKIEDEFHTYEEVCEHCSILRKPDPNLPSCPAAICDDRGDTAHQLLKDGNCNDDCSTDACTSNYRILRAEHDICDEDTLSRDAEEGIHDFEESCELFNCNILDDERAAAQVNCVKAKETETSGSPSSARIVVVGAGAVLGAVLLVAN